MNSIFEPVTDLFVVLDADGCILKFAPVNPLIPFTLGGNSLGDVFRDLVPAPQLDSLVAHMHNAAKMRQSAHCVIELAIGIVARSFLVLFLPMSHRQVMMGIREVTKYKPFQTLLKCQIEELTALARIAKIVLTQSNQDQALKSIIDQTIALLHANRVSILISERGELFALDPGGSDVSDHLEIDEYVLRSGKPIHASGVKIHERTPQEIERAPQSIIAAPLRSDNKVIGVIEAIANKPNAFDIVALRQLNAVAIWAAIAVGNARPFRHVRLIPAFSSRPLMPMSAHA